MHARETRVGVRIAFIGFVSGGDAEKGRKGAEDMTGVNAAMPSILDLSERIF